MSKICDSTAVGSSDDEDAMDYLSESSGNETDWWFFGETINCIKISINGLHTETKLSSIANSQGQSG